MKRLLSLLFALLVALAPLAVALNLSGCAAVQAMNAKPVWGVRSDPDFGRCVFAGSWFGTAPGARTLITAHACGRVENGTTPAPMPDAAAPDAAAAPPPAPAPSVTELPPILITADAGAPLSSDAQ